MQAHRRCEETGNEENRKNVENICSGLSHSLALWRHLSNKSTPGHAHNSAHHQLACRTSLSLACCLWRLLVNTADATLPCVPPVLRGLVVNGAVRVSAPQLHRRLSALLEIVDPTSHQVYTVCVCLLYVCVCVLIHYVLYNMYVFSAIFCVLCVCVCRLQKELRSSSRPSKTWPPA